MSLFFVLPLIISCFLSQTKQKLPALFYSDFYDNLPTVVRFLDPVGNLFVISTKETKGRVFLTHGSTCIGEVYKLISGGWVTICLAHAFTFHLQVRDRMGRHVKYPSPSQRFGLGEAPFGLPVGYGEVDKFLFIDAVHFHHSCVKYLSFEEVNTPYLVCMNILTFSSFAASLLLILILVLRNCIYFPFQFLHVGFCQIAFPPRCTSVTLVNFRGRHWVCKFQWRSTRPGYCCITDGWPIFRGLNGLGVGDALKFGVAKKNRKHLFVKVL